MNVEFWDSRYGAEAYAYGKAPNSFLKKQMSILAKANDGYKKKVLCAAEGEGRNAVFLATQGYDVSAFDMSQEGRNKALKLAGENGVKLDYVVANFKDYQFPEEQFDLLVLIFAHFPAAVKSEYHKKLSTAVKPGGFVVFEAFSKNHLDYSKINPKAGGPKDIEILFSTEEVLRDFGETFEVKLCEEVVDVLNEGEYHDGESCMIRFVGQKK